LYELHLVCRRRNPNVDGFNTALKNNPEKITVKNNLFVKEINNRLFEVC
jgi:hypothetical protein